MVSGQLTSSNSFDLNLSSDHFNNLNVPIGVVSGNIGNLLLVGSKLNNEKLKDLDLKDKHGEEVDNFFSNITNLTQQIKKDI